jgi:hypothetical protein
MFDRAERGLGSVDMSVPDIVARTKGNPQEIMKLVMGGQINVTQGLLAKRLSDSVLAERARMSAAAPSVLQESFPEMAQMAGGLGAMPQTAPQAPALSQPAPAPDQMPVGPEGGLGGMPVPDGMFAGGGAGLGAYAEGDMVTEPDMYQPDEVDINDMLTLVQQQAPRKRTALDAYTQAMQASVNPQQDRKEAERAALFEALGSVQPGTNPFQAFVQGLSGTGRRLVESEKETRKQQMANLKSAVELENMDNEFSQKDYSNALQLKQYKEGRLDKKDERKFEQSMLDDKQAADRANLLLEIGSRERIAAAENATRIRAASIGAAASSGEGSGLKISTVRPVFDALRKEAADRLSKTKRGMTQGFKRDARSQANYNDMLNLMTAELARNRFGNQYPELAATIIEMSGGMDSLERLDAAKSRRTSGGKATGATSPQVLDFNSMK